MTPSQGANYRGDPIRALGGTVYVALTLWKEIGDGSFVSKVWRKMILSRLLSPRKAAKGVSLDKATRHSALTRPIRWEHLFACNAV